MEKDNALALLSEDDPLRLLSSLCEAQGKTTLALEQLKQTQSKLLDSLETSKGCENSVDSGTFGTAFGTAADVAGILSFTDVLTDNKVKEIIKSVAGFALLQAAKHPVVASALAIMASFVGGFAFLQHQVETGELILDIDQSTAQANAMDGILAASNPFIYQGEDELAPGRKGGRAGRRLDEFKQRQATIEQATETLNTIGDIYAASNPHLYQPTASFNAWQTNQPQPTATFDGWQQQQTQLADIQAQTTQFWQTYSESTQNQPITLNVTNNFKGVTQDRKSLNEISDYMARQIIDDLNAGRPLYSHN